MYHLEMKTLIVIY